MAMIDHTSNNIVTNGERRSAASLGWPEIG
jgi:hypothetical protein